MNSWRIVSFAILTRIGQFTTIKGVRCARKNIIYSHKLRIIILECKSFATNISYNLRLFVLKVNFMCCSLGLLGVNGPPSIIEHLLKVTCIDSCIDQLISRTWHGTVFVSFKALLG